MVKNSSNQKQFGLILDEKLTFDDNIKFKFTTVNKLISTFRKIYRYMPRDSLVTVFKSFIRSYVAYAAVIFDKRSNGTFSKLI